MLKKFLVVGLLLVFLAGCGQLNLPFPVANPQPEITSPAPQTSAPARVVPTEAQRTPSRETEAAVDLLPELDELTRRRLRHDRRARHAEVCRRAEEKLAAYV